VAFSATRADGPSADLQGLRFRRFIFLFYLLNHHSVDRERERETETERTRKENEKEEEEEKESGRELD
jgi:hypothetical protein